MDGLTSQNVMSVDGEGLPGKAVIVAILKFILWRTGSQCKSERTGVMVAKTNFFSNDTGKCILNKHLTDQDL